MFFRKTASISQLGDATRTIGRFAPFSVILSGDAIPIRIKHRFACLTGRAEKPLHLIHSFNIKLCGLNFGYSNIFVFFNIPGLRHCIINISLNENFSCRAKNCFCGSGLPFNPKSFVSTLTYPSFTF